MIDYTAACKPWEAGNGRNLSSDPAYGKYKERE